MPGKQIEQRNGLQQPDGTLQNATGRSGVDRVSSLGVNLGARELTLGIGSVALGIGLLHGSEALAQDNEQKRVIGTVEVNSSTIFRAEASTSSSRVQRDFSRTEYDVVEVVEGGLVTLGGRSSSVWYLVRIPGEIARYAYVSQLAIVPDSYQQLEQPEATATPELTLTPEATNTPEAAQNVESGIIGRLIVTSQNVFIRERAGFSRILYRPERYEQFDVISVVQVENDLLANGQPGTYYEVVLPEVDTDEASVQPTPTATLSPTPSPTPTEELGGSASPRTGFVSAEFVRYRANTNATIVTEEVITPTPTPTGTPVEVAQVPTQTPTEQGVAVAAVPSTAIDLAGDMLRPIDVVINTAPRSYSWSLKAYGFTYDIRNIRIDRENLGTITDISGNPIQHGVYSPNNPPPLRPELLPKPLEMNGIMAQYGYIVGTFSFGVALPGTEHEDAFGAITFFAEGSNTQTDVEFSIDELLGSISIGVQGKNGSKVGTPANDLGYIPVGTNPNSNIVIDNNNRTISIPSENGPVVLREGDEFMLAILWNQEISRSARTWGDQMPSRWSKTVFDNDPRNDPEQIAVWPVGIVISDRSTRADN